MNKEQIYRAKRRIQRAKDEEAQLKALWRFCDQAGIDNFSFVSSNLELTNSTLNTKRLDGLPSAWSKRYAEENYKDSDLTVQHCRNNTAPSNG